MVFAAAMARLCRRALETSAALRASGGRLCAARSAFSSDSTLLAAADSVAVAASTGAPEATTIPPASAVATPRRPIRRRVGAKLEATDMVVLHLERGPPYDAYQSVIGYRDVRLSVSATFSHKFSIGRSRSVSVPASAPCQAGR